LRENGLIPEKINKLYQGQPNIVDGILNKEINLVINTPSGKDSQFDDSYIRKAAIKHKVPYITTMAAALASVKGIAAFKENSDKETRLKSLQEYHEDITT
jgi:carbamoyl-phosphate synthase large subunit